jgi:prevent-host-death family protein
MPQVNMLEAKTRLSKLVEAVETGKENEIILARNGRPVARIVPLERPALPVDTSKRLGIAEGLFGELGEEWFQEFEALDQVVWREALKRPLYSTYSAAKRAERRKKSK